MLPPGFKWSHAIQWSKGPEDCLLLDSTQVVRLLQRVDGSWFALLDVHLDWDERPRWVSCSSYDNGRAGAEVWASRHEARLREQVADIRARRRRPGASAED